MNITEMHNMEMGPYKKQRIRTTRSCDECSRRRRKCNGDLPCLLCLEKGRTCKYTREVRKRGPKKGGGNDELLPRKQNHNNNTVGNLWDTTSSAYLSTTTRDSIDQRRSLDIDSHSMKSHENSAINDMPSSNRSNGEENSCESVLINIYPTAMLKPHHHQMEASCLMKDKSIENIHNSVILSPPHEGNKEIFRFRSADPSEWTYFTFFTLRLIDQENQLLSFPDYYFKWVYPQVPGLPRDIFEDQMADIPLYLLHAFYALCLIFPKRGSLKLSSFAHYSYASRLIQMDLEKSTPWTVCGCIHLAKFALTTRRKGSALSYYSLAICQCHYLGISQDIELTWKSPIGNSLSLKSFQRSLYLHLYRLDLYMSINHERPPIIVDPISSSMVTDFSVPNYPSEITNSLTYAKYYAPLLSITRSILLEESQCFALSPEFIVKYTIEIDTWYNDTLSPILKYDSGSNNYWKGRYASIISYHYFTLHLLLKRSPFLSSLEAARFSCESDCDVALVSEILEQCNQVVNIARAFINGPRSTTDCVSVMTKHFLFFTGLFLCAALGVCGTETQSNHLANSINSLLIALEFYSCGPDHKSTLQACFHSPKLASDLLRSNPIKWKL